MIKVYCDSCGKEIDSDEKQYKIKIRCRALIGEKELEKHMHEGCAVRFLGADNVAEHERKQEDLRKRVAARKAAANIAANKGE